MAHNGGRQGGGGGNQNMNEHVEFTVKVRNPYDTIITMITIITLYYAFTANPHLTNTQSFAQCLLHPTPIPRLSPKGRRRPLPHRIRKHNPPRLS